MPVTLNMASKLSWLKRIRWPKLQQKIASSALNFTDPILRELLSISRNDDGLWIGFQPGEENVEFQLIDGQLVMRARTNSLGPGYHAFLVDWLDRLADELKLHWTPAPGKDSGDSSGYFTHRQYERLQATMLTWLCDTAVHLLSPDMQEMTEIRLSWAWNQPVPVTSAFAISQMGEWDREWFSALLKDTGPALAAKLLAYFPWWSRDRDARYYLNLGYLMMRVTLPWHVPVTDSEHTCFQFSLAALERARQLDPDIELPVAELQEARALLQSKDQRLRPQSQGLGVRRRLVNWPAIGDWRIQLPGYYYVQTSNDGNVTTFRFADHLIEISSISARSKTTGKPAPVEDLLALTDAPPTELIRYENRYLRGHAHCVVSREADRDTFTLHGKMATDGELCIVTINFADPADHDWAVQAWQSLSHPPVGRG